MNDTYSWYQNLIKPSWAPPSTVFGPVWTLLYAIIAVTFGTVFYKAITREIPWMVALPFGLNLIFNFLFTPLQFGLKNNLLASIDILLVLVTLIWAFYAIYAFGQKPNVATSGTTYNWIIYANIPYLLWVAFASVLQLSLTYLNWK